MITAIVLIKTSVDRIPEIAEQIASLDSVSEVFSVTGTYDLIAMVRVRQHEDLAEVIPGRISKIRACSARTRTWRSVRTRSTTWRRRSRSAWTPRACLPDQAGSEPPRLPAGPSGGWCVQLQGGGGSRRGASATGDNAADVRASHRDRRQDPEERP